MQSLVDILINQIIMSLFSEPDTLEAINESAASGGSIWKYVAIAQFVIIAFLAHKLYRKSQKTHFANVNKETVKEAANKEFDMENVVNSINKAKPLFKELSKKCHPDKFANSDKYESALEIYQKITRNKRNYSKLLELKELAQEQLNINVVD